MLSLNLPLLVCVHFLAILAGTCPVRDAGQKKRERARARASNRPLRHNVALYSLQTKRLMIIEPHANAPSPPPPRSSAVCWLSIKIVNIFTLNIRPETSKTRPRPTRWDLVWDGVLASPGKDVLCEFRDKSFLGLGVFFLFFFHFRHTHIHGTVGLVV